MTFSRKKHLLALCFVAGLISALNQTSARAAPAVSVFYAPQYTSPRGTGATANNTSSIGFGGGGLRLEFRGGGQMGFDIGASYELLAFNSRYVTAISVPAGFRFWLGRNFSLAVGGYYEMLTTNLPSTLSGTNYGLLFGGGFNLPVGTHALLLEAYYKYGLPNLATAAGSTFSLTEIVGNIGIRFGAGK